MSTSKSDSHERTQQKLRTRLHIIESAKRLRDSGTTDYSLEDVAEEAKVSRATIYRYFPSVSALHVELGLVAQLKSPEDLLARAPEDPFERVQLVHAHAFELTAENEAQFRAFLKSSMDLWERHNDRDGRGPLRGARRVALVESALAPWKNEFTAAEFRRLVQSVALLTFFEPFLVLKDVFHLENKDADKVIRFALEALLTGARGMKRSKTTKPRAKPSPSCSS